MKVKELIKLLKKYNSDELVLSDYGYDIVGVEIQEFVHNKNEIGYRTPLKGNRLKKFRALVIISEQS